MPLVENLTSAVGAEVVALESSPHWSPENRAEISLGCRVVTAFGRRVLRAKGLAGHWLAVASLTTITLVIATLSFGAMLLRGSLTFDRLVVAAWPPLIALATLAFAWQATAYLLESEKLLLDLSASLTDQQLIKTWRLRFSIRRQVLVASILAVVGASITAWFSWRIGVRSFAAILYTSAVLISAFLGGLGFYVGAWSPKLSYSASRCRLMLNPFSPGNSEGLKAVASLYGKIVFNGVLVGIVLCGQLLLIAFRYSALWRRLWVFSIVVVAWIAVAWVFGVVHYHLHIVIMRTRCTTRLELRGLIERAYQALTPTPKEDSLKVLTGLIDLDEMVRMSRSFALNFLLVLQVFSSVAAAAVPLLLPIIKEKLENGERTTTTVGKSPVVHFPATEGASTYWKRSGNSSASPASPAASPTTGRGPSKPTSSRLTRP
jgi:hypothetical protein